MIRRTWTVDETTTFERDETMIRIDGQVVFYLEDIDEVIQVLREIQRSAKDVNSDTPGPAGSQPDEAAVAPGRQRTGKPRRGG